MNVRIFLSIVLLQVGCCPLFAQNDEYMSWEEMLEVGQEWVAERLEPEVVESIDFELLQKNMEGIQQWFQGEYVLDLPRLKKGAEWTLTVLEQVDGGAHYAEWLRSRMDYFEVAEELEAVTPKPPPDRLGVKQPRHTTPTPTRQRVAWRKKIASKPTPKGADALVPPLKKVFKGVGTPEELVWLAEVESSFNPEARSPVGAVGLFQFMPRTAQSMGLKLKPKDERKQPLKNGKAAATYLNYLHGRFKDWPLALAAYNAGEGRVSGLLKKHKAKSFDRIFKYLPAETQMYVPKVDAVLQKREQVPLHKLPAPVKRG